MSSDLTIIIGPMFSGKTSELIKKVRRAVIRNKEVIVIKPKIDNRYSDNQLLTHDGMSIECINIDTDISLLDALPISKSIDFIAIDEAQFFKDLYAFVKYYLHKGKEIVVAGLDGDYKREKFGEVLDLIPLSKSVIKLSAVCNVCGKEAHFTYRTTDDKEQVLVGETDKYEARCWDCWEKGMKARQNEVLMEKR